MTEFTELTDPRDLSRAYDQILLPSFPPQELVSLDTIVAGVGGGATSVVALFDDRELAAVAVGDHDADTAITLLSYLAAAPRGRGRGAGGTVLDGALSAWRERWAPGILLAEIEDPAAHRASDAHGDPVRRRRFYAAHGARALDLPYFQPSLRAGSPRVAGMMLIVWPGTRDWIRDDSLLVTEPLRRYLADYTDDDVPDSPEADRAALLSAAAVDALPLLTLD